MNLRFISLFTILTSIIIFNSVRPLTASENVSTIRIATPEWKETTNKDGTGLYFDIIRKVFEPSGISLSFEIVPWKRAVEKVKNHEADALPGAYYISSRKGFNDIFPLYPIDNEITSVIYKNGKVRNWKGQESISGKSIIWLRGYNYHNHLDVQVSFYEVDKPEQAFPLIDLDRYDFYMDALSDIQVYIRNKLFDPQKYEIRPVIRKNLFLRFADTDKSKLLIEIYDKRVPELIATGEMEKLFNKWNRDIVLFEPRRSE